MTDNEHRVDLIATIANALIYHTDSPAKLDSAERKEIANAWADAHPEQVDQLIDKHGEYVSDVADDQDVMAGVVDYAKECLGVDYLSRYRTPLYG